MAEKSFDKGKGGEKESLLENENLLRVEPLKVEPVLGDTPPGIEPKRPLVVPLKEIQEKKEEKAIISPVSAQVKIEIPPKIEGKNSPFFRFLFILSFAFMAVALVLLLLPLLDVPIPPFLSSVINLIAPIVRRK